MESLSKSFTTDSQRVRQGQAARETILFPSLRLGLSSNAPTSISIDAISAIEPHPEYRNVSPVLAEARAAVVSAYDTLKAARLAGSNLFAEVAKAHMRQAIVFTRLAKHEFRKDREAAIEEDDAAKPTVEDGPCLTIIHIAHSSNDWGTLRI